MKAFSVGVLRVILCEVSHLSKSSNGGVCLCFGQRQISGEVRMQQQSSLVNPVALAMATVGTGVSLYSTRRMSERERSEHPDHAWNEGARWQQWVITGSRTSLYVREGLRRRRSEWEFVSWCHSEKKVHVSLEKTCQVCIWSQYEELPCIIFLVLFFF